MAGRVKRLLVGMLGPAARFVEALEPARRAWAHARLRTRLRDAVPVSTVVLGAPEVHGSGRIRLGEGLLLYPGLYLETQEGGEIVVGDRVVISRGVHLVSYARIEIGGGAMIGEYTSVRDANHRRDPALPLRDSGHDSAPVTIGRGAWLGRGVTVLPGVTIGEGAVVGANAVVTRDVPAGAVVGGVPARPLATRS